jgi:hypothetical protein
VETILTALLAATSMCIAAAQRVESDILIDNVTLISPERVAPLEHADVAIREGRIADVGTHLVPGPHTRKIDGSGRFLVPGLIDSHVHVGYSAALDDDAITAHPDLWAAYRAQLPRAYWPSEVRWRPLSTLTRHNYSMTATVECNATWNVRRLSESTNPRIP